MKRFLSSHPNCLFQCTSVFLTIFLCENYTSYASFKTLLSYLAALFFSLPHKCALENIYIIYSWPYFSPLPLYLFFYIPHYPFLSVLLCFVLFYFTSSFSHFPSVFLVCMPYLICTSSYILQLISYSSLSLFPVYFYASHSLTCPLFFHLASFPPSASPPHSLSPQTTLFAHYFSFHLYFKPSSLVSQPPSHSLALSLHLLFFSIM